MIHILNGDSLGEFFPASIKGDKIICRECMIDGPRDGADPTSILSTRESYLSNLHPDPHFYSSSCIPEFERIMSISTDHELCLWFEDDLFCQSNMWFCIYLLVHHDIYPTTYLVRPVQNLRYGFSALDVDGLVDIFNNRILLTSEYLAKFKDLWLAYQAKDLERLQSIGMTLTGLSFVKDAIQAEIHRYDLPIGQPEKIMRGILDELDTPSFEEAFKLFADRAAIYGFGDNQAKMIYDSILNAHS